MRRHLIIISSGLLFLISLTQDAFLIEGNDPRAWASGWGLLLFGWIGIGYGGGHLCWLANPLVLASWVFYFLRRRSVAITCSALALVFALIFLAADEIVRSEAPEYAAITSLEVGFWLWVSSMILAVLAALMTKRQNAPAQQAEAGDHIPR